MMFSIRFGHIGDAAVLARIAEKLFRQTYEDQFVPSDMERHVASSFSESLQRAELSDPGILTILIEEHGTAVGFAQLRFHACPTPEGSAEDTELWRIYVDKAYHGSGAGKKLLNAVTSEAIARGSQQIWLGVWEKNPRAISFYQKHQFSIVGRHDFVVGTDVQNDLILLRSTQST